MKCLSISSFLLIFLFVFIVFSGCKKDEAPTAPQNHLPKIESLTANPAIVLVNTETTVTCIATDEDGDNLTITWSSKRGAFPNGAVGISVKWVAPSTAGTDTINVILNDGKQTVQRKLEILVGTIPANPTLLSPLNNASSVITSPMLTWNSVSNATTYSIQVSTNDSFADLVINQSGLVALTYQISNLDNGREYYWRVNASNKYGISEWSPKWSFVTSCILSVSLFDKTYSVISIGKQCWLKENLDVGLMIPGTQNQVFGSTIEKYCYDDKVENCEKYGGLYQWNEAMAYATMEGAQGICPAGWHIPTKENFQTLVAYVNNDGNALKAVGQGTGEGAGTNSSNFSSLLAGFRHLYSWVPLAKFEDLGRAAHYWTSSENSSSTSGQFLLTEDSYRIQTTNADKMGGFSIRCIKD